MKNKMNENIYFRTSTHVSASFTGHANPCLSHLSVRVELDMRLADSSLLIAHLSKEKKNDRDMRFETDLFEMWLKLCILHKFGCVFHSDPNSSKIFSGLEKFFQRILNTLNFKEFNIS